MFTTKGPDITVAAGQTTSNVITADANYEGGFSGIMLYAPAVLLEAGTIEVSDSRDGTGTFRTLQTNSDISGAAADLAIPAAGKARFYKELMSANSFRIKLGGAAALQRVFNTSFVVES